MFCSDRIQLPGLITLILMMVLVSDSKRLDWAIDVNRTVTAPLGSSLTIPCKFRHPETLSNNLQVFWKTPGKSECSKNEKEKNAFVFHSNETCVIEKYRGKTKLIGDPLKGECTLQIINIRADEDNIYVRVSVKGGDFSFFNDSVSISVTDVTLNDTNVTAVAAEIMNIAIFVPVAALLIILIVAGIFFCIKRKRSQTFTREESGYYANFSRASSNSRNRGEGFKDDKKLPQPKVIDEPVYINVEASRSQTVQRMEDTDNIYANMDYSK